MEVENKAEDEDRPDARRPRMVKEKGGSDAARLRVIVAAQGVPHSCGENQDVRLGCWLVPRACLGRRRSVMTGNVSGVEAGVAAAE